MFGIVLVILPVKTLLRFDRGSGHRLYTKTLQKTGDSKKALESAGKFYRLFGMGFILLAICFIYFQ